MKDFNLLWRGLFGSTYDAVSTTRTTDRNVRKQKKKQSDLRSALTYVLLGFGALTFGVLIHCFDPYHILYEWKLKFGPGGEIFSLWEKPPVHLYLKVYLFNITNSEEYMSGKADKLHFQEVGPYVYREMMSHENVTFNDNDTLTASPYHPLIWQPELSEGRREDDLLILPNIALLSIADVVAKQSVFTRMGLNFIVRQTKTQPLVQMTAREFMFGYKSTLMDLGNTFMSSWIYFDKLGLIDRMYEFRGDTETVFTGYQHGLSNLGLLDTYNGATRIPQWESPCGDIRFSSDGTKFPSNIQPNDTLLFFRKSMCRAKELVHVDEAVVDGFQGYVYHFANDTDDNGRVHAKNRCFCKETDIEQCKPNGLLDVRGCYYGFPIALSYPHFLDGDNVLFSKVASGLNPDPEKHRSYFIIEPKSGTPLKLAARYQINMALGDIQSISHTERFANMYLPMLWTEIGMYGLPTMLKIRFKLYLEILPVAQTCLMYFLFIAAPLALVYAIRKFIASRRPTPPNQTPWIQDDLVLNIDRKLSSYIPERRLSMNAKEMEVYLSSVVTPLNQGIFSNSEEV